MDKTIFNFWLNDDNKKYLTKDAEKRDWSIAQLINNIIAWYYKTRQNLTK